MEKSINKDLKDLLIGSSVILLYILAMTFSYDIIVGFGIDYNNLSSVMKSFCIIIYEVILLGIIMFIYRKTFISNLKDFIKNFKTYIDKYIKYWFLMLGLMIISNLIITQFTSSEIANNQEVIIDSLKSYPIYTFIVTVFIAPFVEEFVFRLSFRKIFNHTNILFIIFSGFVFGLMHVLGDLSNIYDLLFIIPYSIPGFIFAYLYCKVENICLPISIHFLHNSVMMILQIALLILK